MALEIAVMQALDPSITVEGGLLWIEVVTIPILQSQFACCLGTDKQDR